MKKIKKNQNKNEKLAPIIQKYIYFTIKHIQGDVQKNSIWLENLYIKHKESLKKDNNKNNIYKFTEFEKLIYFGESYWIKFGNTINNILEKLWFRSSNSRNNRN